MSAMNENKENSFIEILKFSIVTLLIVVPFRMFVAKPFIVDGASMSPTFETGNYLIIDQVTYKINSPQRGDVIVFKYPKDTTKYFIKRIIGLPNEKIEIKDGKVTIYSEENPDGIQLTEDYVKNISTEDFEYQLGENEYFVMGDNRANSSDSRIWGSVDEKLIVGRALIELFPLNKIGLMPGDTDYNY